MPPGPIELLEANRRQRVPRFGGLSPPSRASVTLWEATAPVKLPTTPCPGTG